jgi:hypothetical protein
VGSSKPIRRIDVLRHAKVQINEALAALYAALRRGRRS